MPIALVAHREEGLGPNGGASDAIDTAGATLIVIISAFFGGTPPTVSDSKSNSWTSRPVVAGTANDVQLHYCIPTSVGSGHTFQLSGSSIYPSIGILAFRGTHPTTPFDQDARNSGAVSSIEPGSLTAPENGCLYVTGISTDQTSHAASGMTSYSVSYAPGSYLGMGSAWFVQSTAGAFNPTWSYSGTGAVATCMLTFRPAASGHPWYHNAQQ